MKKTALLLAATMVFSPVASIAQDAEPPAQASDEAPAAEADDDDRMICKRTQIIGSKFKKKICGTKDDWDQMAQRGQDAASLMQTKRGFEPGN